MKDVGLTNDLFNRYPHELSGGQCQRVGIARALINKPSVLICDEPVSALDLSIQAQILDLLNSLKNKYKLSLIFVSHDLSVIRSICDRVIVLKHGLIVENRETIDLFNNPKNSYTKKLIWIYALSLIFFSSFLLSGYHVGIEQGIFQEFSGCTGNSLSIIDKNELLKLLNSEVNSCKNVDFRVAGLSLATINFLLSFIIFIFILKVINNEKNK